MKIKAERLEEYIKAGILGKYDVSHIKREEHAKDAERERNAKMQVP